MKTSFFLSLFALVALNGEYVAEIQLTKVTDDQCELIMNSTLILTDGQPATVTLADLEGTTTIDVRVTTE